MTADTPENNTPRGERIAKMLARAGIGSRRAVERMIEAGLVLQNGKPVKTPATLITTTEGITVDGQPVKAIEPPKLWRYHKPPGLITSYHDPEGRRTVFEALPPDMPRVVAVGRLDFSTEGLLLLTNDGGLARFLELPATGWLRRYRVRAFGKASLKFIDTVKSGVTIEGVNYGPIEIEIEKEQGDNIWFKVGIREGKNREIRKVFEHFGMTVNRLIRVSYGPFQLARLPRGGVEPVTPRNFESVLANYLRESGQSTAREPENPERPKSANPRGKSGWAKAAPKAQKPKYKPRPPRDETEVTAAPARPRLRLKDQNPAQPRPARTSGPRPARPKG
jgi:23S rRNA pseudouridine2605 synthase